MLDAAAECLAKMGMPLSDEQRLALTGFVASWMAVKRAEPSPEPVQALLVAPTSQALRRLMDATRSEVLFSSRVRVHSAVLADAVDRLLVGRRPDVVIGLNTLSAASVSILRAQRVIP